MVFNGEKKEACTCLLPSHFECAHIAPLSSLVATKSETNHPGHDLCVSIASKVNSESEFPVECMQYYDAVTILKQGNSNPYAGMSPGEAIDAKRAKFEGHLNSAQIKRRMTTRKNGRFF
jgi:hypothetical protein